MYSVNSNVPISQCSSVFAVSECEKAIKQLIRTHGLAAVKETVHQIGGLGLVELKEEVDLLKNAISEAVSVLGF